MAGSWLFHNVFIATIQFFHFFPWNDLNKVVKSSSSSSSNSIDIRFSQVSHVVGTSHEQITSHEQVTKTSNTSYEHVMNKSWMSLIIVNNSWISQEKIVNRLWANHEYVTSHEEVKNNSREVVISFLVV